MKIDVNPEVMEMVIDPLNQFEGIKASKLFEATGLIPYFVAEAALTAGLETAQDAMDIMNEAYGFGLGEYNLLEDGKGEVSPEGLYTYPEDPDMAPMVKFEWAEGFTVFVYQYALVAVRGPEGDAIMQRMD